MQMYDDPKAKIHVEIELCHVNDDHNSVHLRYPDYLLSLRQNTEGVFYMKILSLQISSSIPLF